MYVILVHVVSRAPLYAYVCRRLSRALLFLEKELHVREDVQVRTQQARSHFEEYRVSVRDRWLGIHVARLPLIDAENVMNWMHFTSTSRFLKPWTACGLRFVYFLPLC